MAELKWVCFSFSLMLLLKLGVGSLNSDEKRDWISYGGGFCLPGFCFGGDGGLELGRYGGGFHSGFGSGGDILGIGGGGNVHFGVGDGAHLGESSGISRAAHLGPGGDLVGFGGGTRGAGNRGHGPGAEVRESMYCRPVSCKGDSCSGLHLHMEKGLYKSLMSKNGVTYNKGKHSSISVHHMPETFKQNENNVSKEDDVHEMKQAAMAPASN